MKDGREIQSISSMTSLWFLQTETEVNLYFRLI